MATIQGWDTDPRTSLKERNSTRRNKVIGAVAAAATVAVAGLGIAAAHGQNTAHNANMSAEAKDSVSRVLNGNVTLNDGAKIRTSPVTNNDPDMDNLAFQLDGKRLMITNPMEHADPATNDVWIGFTDPTAEAEEADTVWANLTQLEEQGVATTQRDAENPDITVQAIGGQLHNTKEPGQPVLANVGHAEFEQ